MNRDLEWSMGAESERVSRREMDLGLKECVKAGVR